MMQLLQVCKLCENGKNCVTVQVMFFFNKECLLIACNRTWSTACDAVPNKNDKFADAYYLRVRTTGEYRISIALVASGICCNYFKDILKNTISGSG